jgi:hypothetical protein
MELVLAALQSHYDGVHFENLKNKRTDLASKRGLPSFVLWENLSEDEYYEMADLSDFDSDTRFRARVDLADIEPAHVVFEGEEEEEIQGVAPGGAAAASSLKPASTEETPKEGLKDIPPVVNPPEPPKLASTEETPKEGLKDIPPVVNPPEPPKLASTEETPKEGLKDIPPVVNPPEPSSSVEGIPGGAAVASSLKPPEPASTEEPPVEEKKKTRGKLPIQVKAEKEYTARLEECVKNLADLI